MYNNPVFVSRVSVKRGENVWCKDSSLYLHIQHIVDSSSHVSTECLMQQKQPFNIRNSTNNPTRTVLFSVPCKYCHQSLFTFYDLRTTQNPPYLHQRSLDLNISINSLSIGILPIVFLKKSSSIVLPLTDFSVGNNNRSLPNLNGWVGYEVWMYLLSVIWAWSCNDATVWKSRRFRTSPVALFCSTVNTKKF